MFVAVRGVTAQEFRSEVMKSLRNWLQFVVVLIMDVICLSEIWLIEESR